MTPGFKATEVGPLPNDWELAPLGDLVKITSGASPSTFRFSSTGIPYFKVEQLSNAEKFLDAADTPYHFERGASVPARSVVFAKRGAAIALNKLRILKSASFMDTNLMSLTPLEGLEYEYLFYALGHIGLWRFADTTSVPQINNKHVKPLLFPLPSDREQRAIAAALSDVDALLEGLDRLVAKKRDLKQAAMQQLLTGQSRLPGFQGEWEVRRLSELGTTFGGLTGKSKADFGTGSAQYVTFMNVVTNTVLDHTTFESVRISASENQNRVERGDLLFNGSSETPEEVALCALVQRDVHNLYLNSFCFGFRPRSDTEADGLFLTYFIRSAEGREIMKSLAQGSTRYNLSKRALLAAEVRVPSLAEQAAIAGVLSDMDAELIALEARRDKTHALKQGMMQELLTGRTRLV